MQRETFQNLKTFTPFQSPLPLYLYKWLNHIDYVIKFGIFKKLYYLIQFRVIDFIFTQNMFYKSVHPSLYNMYVICVSGNIKTWYRDV